MIILLIIETLEFAFFQLPKHCFRCKIFFEVVVRFSFLVAASVVGKRKRYDFLSGNTLPITLCSTTATAIIRKMICRL